jgi:Zn-finger nucleic acid-binding protein
MTAPACPACDARTPLLRQAGEHECHRCTRCGGLWIPAATLTEMVRRALDFPLPPEDPAGRAVLAPAAFRYRPCPDCGEFMNRHNYARLSGVIVDECRAHGTWFDAGELRRVLDFIRAGGLDRKRGRDLEELRERERRARLAEALADRRVSYGPDVAPGTEYLAAESIGTLLRELVD